MAVNNNADDYANKRVGVFFPGNPSYLVSQCVSLIKWYIGEMAGVPNSQRAWGNAKDVGDNLVAAGFATKVTGSPKRGDIAVYKKDGGGFGHIGVVLSGGRLFEANVAIKGRASEYVPELGYSVYAAGIDPINADWRVGSPTYYRLKGYKEVTPKPAKPATKPSPNTGRIARKGTFHVTVDAINVHSTPDAKSKVVAEYTKDQSFNYDSYQIVNGYVWLSYVSNSGVRRYVAEGPNDGNAKNVWGTGGV